MTILKRKISDWNYQMIIDEQNKYNFNIIPDKEIVKPKTLYRYFPFSDYAIDSLYHSYLYASHPDQFNDLYDCYINVCHLSQEKIREITKKFNENNAGKLSKEECTYLFRAEIYRNHGLVSMTENEKDVLMWSYYTENKGFMVEYDYSYFPFTYHGPFKMNYKKDFREIYVKTQYDDKFLVLYMSNIKNIKWQHENEWRFIIEAPEDYPMHIPSNKLFKELGGHDRKFDYPLKAIKSVSLGNHFFEIEETFHVSNQLLNIELKENIEKKSKILDFLFQHHIKTKIITRDTAKGNTFDLDFREGYLKKTATNKYMFNAID